MSTPSLNLTRVLNPAHLWADFSSACGPEVMREAYGWEVPPTTVRGNEDVFQFWTLGGVRVAWSSISEYPKEPGCYELALGVWPAFQSQGLRKEVLALTAEEAFRNSSVEQLTMLVFDSCVTHSQVCLRQAEQGSPWVYAGRFWYPEALRAFTLTRAAWESSRRP